MKTKLPDPEIKELRDFCELLIGSAVITLHKKLKEPKLRVMNIMTGGDDTEFASFSQEVKQDMMNTAVSNVLSSMKNSIAKTMEDVRLYEQVIITCDRVLKGEYKFNSEPKNVSPEP